jgi:NAD(P)-dependent dehydrogenase (short-subunit alcohol dehydrogenase family)
MNNNTYQVLITGTNRGIGLSFVEQYAKDGWNVIACCRNPQSATELQALASKHRNIQIIALDMANFLQIDTVSLQLKDKKIDVLINNAGVYPESSFGNADFDDWVSAFKINTMAPLKMAEAFMPHVAASQLKKIVTLSSKMGSVDDNTSGGSYIYRSSKAAVNMVMKSLSLDLKPYGIAVVTLNPGWVKTDMGGPNGLIDSQTSVIGLRKVIADLSLVSSGKFFGYDGTEIAW